jgi:carbon storage regulator
MLFISRKVDESIIINNDITLTILEVRGRTVKIGFDFPKTASVLRKELYDKIMAENLAAQKASADEFTLLMAEHSDSVGNKE